MHDPGAHPRPERAALDHEVQSMLRALLLCELIEEIDHAAATSTAARGDRVGLAPALLRMTEIRDALDRLDDGTYGICDTCRCQIPFAELKATPVRRACTRCRSAPIPAPTFTTSKVHHTRRSRRERQSGGNG